MIPREDRNVYKVAKAKIFFQPEGYPYGFDVGNLASFTATFDQEITDYNTNEDSLGTPVFSETTSTTASIAFEARNYNKIVQMLAYMSEQTTQAQAATPAPGLVKTILGVPEAGSWIELPENMILTPVVTITQTGGGGAIALAENTHYKVDYDAGEIKIIALPEAFDEDTATGVNVTYGCAEFTKVQYAGFSNGGGIRGALTLRDTNARGPKFLHRFHVVEIRPDGDQNFVSDSDLTTRSFTGRLYQDPTQPAGFEFFTVTKLPDALGR